MLRITKRHLNKVLPSVRYFRNNYIVKGDCGFIEPGQRVLQLVALDIRDDGSIHILDYGYGDAKTSRIYNGEFALDITDIVGRWMAHDIDRKCVIEKIVALTADSLV